MRIIKVFVIGEGVRAVEVGAGATLAQLASGESLSDYDFKVDERDVPRSEWNTTSLDNAKKVWASKGVKGA